MVKTLRFVAKFFGAESESQRLVSGFGIIDDKTYYL